MAENLFGKNLEKPIAILNRWDFGQISRWDSLGLAGTRTDTTRQGFESSARPGADQTGKQVSNGFQIDL